ncbi:MAG: VCBS repeat-containing protein, partial [Caldilinea sp.]
DGKMEVIAAMYDLVILDGATGALKHRAENGSRAWPGVAVADIDADGAPEIVVGRGNDQVTVYNADGSERWTQRPFGAGEVRTLALADIDLDGQLEIVVGRASGGATKQVSVYESDGSVRPGWPARRDGEVGYGWGMYNQNVAVADLTGDGYAEIVGPTDTHYITALDRDGNQLPAHSRYDNINPKGPKVWSQVGVHVDDAVDLRGYANCGVEHRPNFANSAPAIADLDGDGVREIVVVGNVYDCGATPYRSLYEMPFIFNADRSRWQADGYGWTTIPTPDDKAAPLSEDYNMIESAPPNPVIADLDGDGVPEILHASYDGRLHAWWLDKTQQGAWPYSVYDPAEGFFRFASEPIVVDLDNDGKAEVIFTSWPEKGEGRTGRLHILDALGEALFEIDLPPSRTGGWNGGLAAPTIANIDADLDYELVINTVQSGVVAYDLPGTAGARILWGTGRGSYLRNGAK